MLRILLLLTLFLGNFLGYYAHSGITAEQVLGDYWNDPLFGEAATDSTVELEILTGRIWPESLSVSEGEKVRIVVRNKTNTPHMLVFTESLEELSRSEAFQGLVKDELYHATQKKSDGRHHSHEGTNVDDAQSIVKTIDQNPSVFVQGNDMKEVLIKFTKPGYVSYACMIGSHKPKTIGKITIE
jgi:uncharacterized cupredoxin-like copper-binding protein